MASVSISCPSCSATDGVVPRSGDGIFLEPRTGNIAARAVEPSKAEVGVGASAIGLGVAEILLGRHRWPSCKGSGSSEPCGGTSRDRQWR